jgi:hypothetical protein
MDMNIFTMIMVGITSFNTLIMLLMFKAFVVLLEDIRSGGEHTIKWLREIAGNSLKDEEEY